MNKYRCIILLGLCLVLPLTSCQTTTPKATAPPSASKVKTIRNLIQRYINAGNKLDAPNFRLAILDEVAQLYPDPVEPANQQSIKEIARETRRIVAEEYPDSIKAIKTNATAEADKKQLDEKARKDEIDERVRQYYRDKGQYSQKVFTELKAKSRKENETKGYIYFQDKLMVPSKVADHLIKTLGKAVRKKPVP